MPANGQGENAQSRVVATTPPHVQVIGLGGTDGEVPGSGSMYNAFLNERVNKSNNRNMGPSRAYSAVGDARLPSIKMSQRQTGRTS